MTRMSLADVRVRVSALDGSVERTHERVLISYDDLASPEETLGKPLIGDLTGPHSARRGEYRVVYVIHDDTVLVESAYLRRRADV